MRSTEIDILSPVPARRLRLNLKRRLNVREDEADKLLSVAEEKIRGILIGLVNDHGLRVTAAEIDTRPLAEFRVSLDYER